MSERSDFWSRRRANVSREESAVEKARQQAQDADQQAAFEAQDDDTILQALGLPDPETLTPKDAAAFMARAVPARLRRRAMRALFRAHPGLSLPDGLQDYDDDYTVAPPDLRPLIAKWEPVVRDVAQRAQAALDQEVPPPLEEVALVEAGADGAPEVVPDDMPEAEAEALPRPRRMVFHAKDTA